MLLDQETLFPCGVMRTPGFGSNSSTVFGVLSCEKMRKQARAHCTQSDFCFAAPLFVIDIVFQEWDKSTIIPFLFVQVLSIFGGLVASLKCMLLN